jgi:DNA modification methylase
MNNDNVFKLESGDCIEVLKKYPDNYFHSIVTDPPYNTGNVRKGADKWDSFKDNKSFQKWCEKWGRECFRVLKPGGHIISFSANRTYHRMTTALEDVGFEIYDTINWVYFSGNMPKGLRSKDNKRSTTLRPCNEPAVLAKKPIQEKTIVEQYKKTKTGFLFIDKCRFPAGSPHWLGPNDDPMKGWKDEKLNPFSGGQLFDHNKKDGYKKETVDLGKFAPTEGRFPANIFHCNKPSKKEKDAGVRASSNNKNGRRNFHVSVKPIKLMRWLVKLVTPEGGYVLDPFLGSGTTAVAAILDGYKCVGIERNDDYVHIIKGRTNAAMKARSIMNKKPKKS